MNEIAINDRTIQRLVDGQLNESERSALLLAAESSPELWRRMALAFVEEQVWSESIPDAVRDEERVALAPQFPPAFAAGGRRGVWLMALGAMVLIVATVGLRFLAAPPAAPSRSEFADKTPAVNNNPSILQVGDHSIPVYESSEPMEEYWVQWRQQMDELHRAGLEVEPNTHFISGNAPDGRSFVVPIHRYQLRQRFQ